jgi:arginyl-tRNA synthetase
LTYYLQQLAALLHTFYNRHRILPSGTDQEVFEQASEGQTVAAPPRETIGPDRTAARLALMRGVQQVIKNGLGILGITAPERM